MKIKTYIIAALIALALTYGAFLAGANIGAAKGGNIYEKAAFNLMAVTHTTLSGTGTITDDFGDETKTDASACLPVSAWRLVPMVLCAAAAFVSMRKTKSSSLLNVFSGALAISIIFAAAMYLTAPHLTCRVGSSALPHIGDTELALPELVYTPKASSALLCGFVISFIFSYVGGILALIGKNKSDFHKAFVGAITAMATVILILAVLMTGAYFGTKIRKSTPFYSYCNTCPFVKLLLWSGTLGSDLSLKVTSASQGEKPKTVIGYNINIYKHNKDLKKPLPPYVYVLSLLAALAVFFGAKTAGKLGAKNRFGTALAMTLILYGAALIIVKFTGLYIKTADPDFTVIQQAAPAADPMMFVCAVVMFIFAYSGVKVSKKR